MQIIGNQTDTNLGAKALNVLNVTPTFYPATYWGGPVYSTYGLCNALAKIPGVTLKVLTTNSAGARLVDSLKVDNSPAYYPGGYRVFFHDRWWGASFSPGMLLQLLPMIQWADVVHLQAVYSSPTIPTLLLCNLLRKPLVWSPRGALQRWERASKPMLKWLWEQVCRKAIGNGKSVLHVTADREAQAARERIPGIPIAIIPNGVDVPSQFLSRKWKPEGTLRLMFLGRLDPIKGIENLLGAIQGIRDVSLVIFGSGLPGYEDTLRENVRKLGLASHARFVGHIEGAAKALAFLNADVCVVPSFSENFGMVVAEALAHGVPVIASTGTPWQSLENKQCGLWVANDPDSLRQAIVRISEMDLQGMGTRGRDWMLKDFGWDSISQRMMRLYKTLCTSDRD